MVDGETREDWLVFHTIPLNPRSASRGPLVEQGTRQAYLVVAVLSDRVQRLSQWVGLDGVDL
jgi:hypothetical protein